MRLEGRTVLLTGASGGLGAAIARALHARGAAIVATGRRAEALEALRIELGDRVEPRPADLADAAEVRRLAEHATSVDGLVAGAALPGTGSLDTYTEAEMDRALSVNLRAPMQLARALAPAMAERGRGHLVFLSSLSGKVTAPGAAIYSATKFGLRGFALSLREDLHGSGVGVTTVTPGFVSDAGMWADSGLELPRGVALRSPEEVGAAVVSGIERNRAEIEVAPLGLRASARLYGVAPSLVAAASRRIGAKRFATELAEAQRGKR